MTSTTPPLPVWYRIMSRLETMGGFSPSMMALIESSDVDPRHGQDILRRLHEKRLINIATGKCDHLGNPVQLLVRDQAEWFRIYIGVRQ